MGWGHREKTGGGGKGDMIYVQGGIWVTGREGVMSLMLLLRNDTLCGRALKIELRNCICTQLSLPQSFHSLHLCLPSWCGRRMGGLMRKTEKWPLGGLNPEMGAGVQSTFRRECIPSFSFFRTKERGNVLVRKSKTAIKITMFQLDEE